jgi:di/tricarboxylate transporter
MGPEGWFTLIVVLAMTVAMAREWLSPDMLMFVGMGVVTVAGVITPEQAIAGFANPALATIGVLFVVAAAVQETGGLSMITGVLFGRTKSPRVGLYRLTIPVAIMSAFLNNTPIVAMLIPAVRDFARQVGERPSRYLIPLSFAAMLGGTCTLIGTSPNLVVSGLLQASGLEPLGMLELAAVGVPTTLFGLLYLGTLGYWLLGSSGRPDDPVDHIREYLAEVEVAKDSPLVGRTIEGAGLRSLPGLFLVEIRHADGRADRPVKPEDRIEPGDHLVFTGNLETVKDLRKLPGLTPLQHVDGAEGRLYEVVVSHRSWLVGQSVRDAGFRRRFDAAILAVHRHGERIDGKIGDIVLHAGDNLLLAASPGFRRAFSDHPDFYLVSEVDSEDPPRYRLAPLALLITLLLVLVPVFTDVPMITAAMGAVIALVSTGCITANGARRAVSWNVLILIGSAFGVAKAMDVSGAAAGVAHVIVALTSSLGPRATLAALYLIAVVCASFISNASTAALMFPIALTAAEASGADPRPFAIALAMAASAAFSSPVGYAANILVHGPGGYRYLDFVKVGLPLNVGCFLIVIALLPEIWPLVP